MDVVYRMTHIGMNNCSLYECIGYICHNHESRCAGLVESSDINNLYDGHVLNRVLFICQLKGCNSGIVRYQPRIEQSDSLVKIYNHGTNIASLYPLFNVACLSG